MTTRAATAAALAGTLGLAAACWVVALWQLTGMDLPVALAIAGLGLLIVITPSLVPGLGPSM